VDGINGTAGMDMEVSSHLCLRSRQKKPEGRCIPRMPDSRGTGASPGQDDRRRKQKTMLPVLIR
jgi:hypothetical protein